MQNCLDMPFPRGGALNRLCTFFGTTPAARRAAERILKMAGNGTFQTYFLTYIEAFGTFKSCGIVR